MIKLKDILKEIYTGSLPRYLYHGTFYPLVKSIQMKGLIPGGNGIQSYPFISGNEWVYLTNSKRLALDMVADAEGKEIPSEWFFDVALLTIDIKKINDKKLFEQDPYLEKVRQSTGEPYKTRSFRYKGIIPINAIINIERIKID